MILGIAIPIGALDRLDKAGAIDPVKTLKEAMLLAFSYAKGILETGAWDMPVEDTPPHDGGTLEMGGPGQ